jgi:hypothetical protein
MSDDPILAPIAALRADLLAELGKTRAEIMERDAVLTCPSTAIEIVGFRRQALDFIWEKCWPIPACIFGCA